MANAVLAATGILASAGGGSTDFSTVTTGVSNLMSIVTTMLQTILANPILATLFVSGFIGIAIGILSSLKHA